MATKIPSAFSNDVDSPLKFMHLCANCGHIWDRLVMCFAGFGGKAHQTQEVRVRWAFRLRGLLTAAASGCPFCGFIAVRFFDSSASRMVGGTPELIVNPVACCANAPSGELSKSLVERLAELTKVCNEEPDDSLVFHLIPSHSQGKAFPDFDKIKVEITESGMGKEKLRKLIGLRRHIKLEVFALEGTSAAASISTRPVNLLRDSADTFEQVRKWTAECRDHHGDCPKFDIPRLPTRVIEILDSKSLKLHTTGGQAAYTALSYCWGGQQTFATTTETLAKRCEGFRLSDLPKTLREAILVTRKLGVRYIWIDSLCIVQDSTGDKERELSGMNRVYKNAYVTICAASARSCHDGFLRGAGECRLHPGSGMLQDLFKVPYRCPNSVVGSIYMREEQQYSASVESTSRRAWTLQERLLSPRVLSYGSRLVWYCRTAQYSSGGTEDFSFDIIGNGIRQFHPYTLSLSREASSSPAWLDFFTLRQLYDTWRRAVMEYTRRELTFPADKLPAIAGLAAEFQKLTGDTYLAGLWRNNLPFELMWSINPDVSVSHPPTWRAPSWSWASLDNAVSFDKITDDSTLLARIVKCEVTPRSEIAPLGEVVSGSLQVEAPLVHVDRDLVREMVHQEAEKPTPDPLDGSLELLKLHTNSNTKTKSSRSFSISKPHRSRHSATANELPKQTESPKWEPPEDVYCLVMFSRSWSWNASRKVKEPDRTCYSGLVLKPVNGNFERIASFYNQKREWLSRTSRQIVTIV